MAVLAPDVEEFLRGSQLAAISTVRANGQPHVVPVWYEWDGREFVVSSMRDTQKVRNISARGVSALSIYSSELPYRQVTAEGPARLGPMLDNVWRERVAIRYLGEAAGRAYAHDTADMDLVAIHIRPLKWHLEGFGASGDAD
jgi:PPOX class probable F420-dependent enzyme